MLFDLGCGLGHFLAESQRQRLAGNMSAVSSVGWLIFGAGAWMVFVLLPEATSQNQPFVRHSNGE